MSGPGRSSRDASSSRYTPGSTRGNERVGGHQHSVSEHSLQHYTALRQGVTEYVVDQDMDPNQPDPDVDFYPGVERTDYDYAAERQNPFPANIILSTAHLIKGSLASGLLAIHEAYMHGGLWTSLVVTVILGIITTHNMLILVRAAQKLYVTLRVPRLTYPDLVEAAVAIGPLKCLRKHSRKCRLTVDIVLFVEIFGCCCVYQIMLASTAKYVVEGVITPKWRFHMRMYVVGLTFPMLLLSIIRSLNLMVPLTVAADFFIMLCVLVTLYYSIARAGAITDRYAWKNFDGFFLAAGTCMFAIDGITFALPIENHMSKPRYFPVVANIAMPVVISTNAAVGFFGYWGWGEECKVPITSLMPLNVGIIIMQFFLVLVLLISFAIRFYVLFRIVFRYVGDRIVCKERDYYERCLRLLLATSITCVSVAYPNLDPVMSFLGNAFLAPVTFTIPALIETFVFWKDRRVNGHKWYDKIRITTNILIGLVLCGAGFFNIFAGNHKFGSKYAE